MNTYEYDAELMQADGKGGAFVPFPYDIMKEFGKKNQVKIQCTFDGEPYRGIIANMGAGPCVGVLKSIRERLGKKPGDSIHVILWEDTEERVAEMPDELKIELNKPENSAAVTYYNTLSHTKKLEYCRYVSEAKREETRRERVRKAVSLLLEGKKLR